MAYSLIESFLSPSSMLTKCLNWHSFLSPLLWLLLKSFYFESFCFESFLRDFASESFIFRVLHKSFTLASFYKWLLIASVLQKSFSKTILLRCIVQYNVEWLWSRLWSLCITVCVICSDVVVFFWVLIVTKVTILGTNSSAQKIFNHHVSSVGCYSIEFFLIISSSFK